MLDKVTTQEDCMEAFSMHFMSMWWYTTLVSFAWLHWWSSEVVVTWICKFTTTLLGFLELTIVDTLKNSVITMQTDFIEDIANGFQLNDYRQSMLVWVLVKTAKNLRKSSAMQVLNAISTRSSMHRHHFCCESICIVSSLCLTFRRLADLPLLSLFSNVRVLRRTIFAKRESTCVPSI